MNNLEKAKEIIKKYFNSAKCDIFNVSNIVGDSTNTIYDENGLMIDICYYWEYFEVFGLSNEDFNELEKFYNSLKVNRFKLT